MSEQNLNLPVSFPASDLQRLLKPLIVEAIEQEARSIRDGLSDKVSPIRESIDALRAKVSDTTEKIEKKFDDEKEKLTKRGNLVLIPLAATILLGGILVIWGIAGRYIYQVRDEATAQLTELQGIDTKIKDRKDKLDEISKELDSLKTQADQIKDGSAIAALTTQLAGQQGKLDDLSKRVDDLLVRIGAANKPPAAKKTTP